MRVERFPAEFVALEPGAFGRRRMILRAGGRVTEAQDGPIPCNIWGKVDEARRLIREGKPASPDSLRGAIRPA